MKTNPNIALAASNAHMTVREVKTASNGVRYALYTLSNGSKGCSFIPRHIECAKAALEWLTVSMRCVDMMRRDILAVWSGFVAEVGEGDKNFSAITAAFAAVKDGGLAHWYRLEVEKVHRSLGDRRSMAVELRSELRAAGLRRAS